MEEEKEVFEEDFLLDINDETEVYTIESLNNKKRPVEKQMRVYIKPLSGKDLAQIASHIRKDIRDYQKANPEDKREFMDLYNMFSEYWEFAYRIEKLENFRYKEKSEVKEIKTPDELYSFHNSKFATIVSELRLKFMQVDMLNLKN
jgi:hypothetical protein